MQTMLVLEQRCEQAHRTCMAAKNGACLNAVTTRLRSPEIRMEKDSYRQDFASDMQAGPVAEGMFKRGPAPAIWLQAAAAQMEVTWMAARLSIVKPRVCALFRASSAWLLP
eukprot:COSAG01_NODE_3211_length_6414_cov_7.800475_2_plen_111_part_00